jgi:ankyrin repeat protein
MRIQNIHERPSPQALFEAIEGLKYLRSKKLVKLGVDLDARNEDGIAPLHLAVKKGMLKIAGLLLENGADVNIQDIYGNHALHIVLSGRDNNRGVFTNLLLEHGASVLCQDVYYNTPLHTASHHCTADILAMLITMGARVNARNNLGMSPILWAIDGKNEEGDGFLLCECADPNIRTITGESPLTFAISRNCRQLAIKLLDYGSDVNTVTAEGFFFLSLAQKLNQRKLVEILAQRGGRLPEQLPARPVPEYCA